MLRFCASALLLLAALPSLRAEPADFLWTARYVVTVDPARSVIENGAVAVRGDRIVAVGPTSELLRRFQPKHRLDRPQAILMPGLVNTHTHAAMSLLRGIADDLRLQDWLENHIFPAEAKNVNADFVTWGTRLACLEMMLSGTTTFVDMYYFEDQVAQATKEAGLRGVLGETILRFKTPDAGTPEAALAYTERFLSRYRADPLIVPAVAPHALYTNSGDTLKACRRLADRFHAPLLIHVAETRQERDDALRTTGASPVAALDALGIFNGPTVAAHCVWVNDRDIAILKAKSVGVAHNPSSNMKLASGIAPIVKMLAAGVTVGLGTDGPAGSNNDFEMMEEMNLAADLQKVATLDPQVVPARQAVEMATVGGARVAGLQKDIGSLESGKKADMIVIRIDRPHAVPLYDVYSQLVYALKSSDVQDVMVNGRPIVRNGNSLTLNQAEIIAKARAYAGTISASLKQ